jgi:hypothetical protein
MINNQTINSSVNVPPKVPFSSPEGKPPKSVEDVDNAIKEMDRLYKTSFYTWLKSEANIRYLCTFKVSEHE